MALSNTATPYYYGQFRKAVLRGEIPVCREISMEMNRIDELIANPDYYYDDQAVIGWIDFCESELTLTDGAPLHMLDSFKLWGEQLFGWFYFEQQEVFDPDAFHGRGGYVVKDVKKRLTKKQYLIVARGAAKSQYEAYIHAYFLNVDNSTTHQVHTAPTMVQADEVLAPIRTAITQSRGPLFKFLTYGSLMNTSGSAANKQQLASTKKGIQNFINGSLLEIRPMTIDKLQGLNSRINTIDEWLSGDIKEDVVGALEQGAAKNENDDYIIVAVSSEGTVRNGPGDSIKLELQSILKGEYYDPYTSIWWYKLDDVSEVAYPELWIKANPNIKALDKYAAYARDVERAEHNPSARNDILAKRFGIPMEGYTYFFTYEETLPHRKREYKGMLCAMGADLSQGDDFCAFTFLFPLQNGKFGIKTRCYISERTLHKLPPALRQEYQKFMNEDSLCIMNGTVLDMMDVYDELDQWLEEKEYDVTCVGYDRYNADGFIDRWTRENGPFGIEKVIQGAKTESVPLGELKKMAEDRALLFDEELMKFAMGNCIVIEDTNGNRKLYKKRYEEKIDPVAALMDAYVSFKINQEAFE